MATIKEVAQRANVSKATVSRVINQNLKVSPEARERVMTAMKELGYRPNALAQALATNRTRTIGMVVSDLSGSFFGPMMKAAEKVIRDAGWQLVITNGQGQAEYEREAINYLLNRPCDALILNIYAMSENELIELSQQETPVVIVNRNIEALANNCIYLDNYHGGRQATEYLLSLGHRRIAFLAGHFSHYDSQERLRGYRDALTDYDLEVDNSIIFDDDYNYQGGRRMCEQLLHSKQSFSAIFCGNDLIAIGARDVLQEAGLSVPKDVSLIGFDNILFGEHLTPPLSTIYFPVKEMGEQAGHLALTQIANQQYHVEHKLQPKLVIRKSTQEKT